MNKLFMLVFLTTFPSFSWASDPECKVKSMRHGSAQMECTCKANQVISENSGILSCEDETISYVPTNCSYNAQTKTVFKCICDHPLSPAEERERFSSSDRQQGSQVSVYSYVINATGDQCDRVEWVLAGELIECSGGIDPIVKEISKLFKVLDSKVIRSQGTHILSCGARTGHKAWVKIYSRDRAGVQALIDAP